MIRPIESSIEIAFDKLSSDRLADLERLENRLPDYPVKSNDLRSSPGIGYRFTSADGKRILQVGLDGFTLGFLGFEPEFSSLLAEAKRLWDTVTSSIKAISINRVALRTVTELNVGALPTLPAGILQSLTAFDMRLVMSDSGSTAVAIVTEYLRPASLGSKAATILLDIDVHQVIASS